jgi:Flp pilus assembly protein TadB
MLLECFDFLKEGSPNVLRDFLFLVLFFVLLIVWLVSWAAFHVAGGLIHLLLIIAVIFLILHFVRGRSRV